MNITIQVSIDATDANKFTVTIGRADLTNQGTGSIPLQWDIAPANSAWNFAGNGIDVKNDNAGVFDPVAVGGPKRRTTNRKSGKAYGTTGVDRIYDYKVTVSNGTTTLIIDPNIINQP